MVDKDALFDELSEKIPAAKYSVFCNKMGVEFDVAKNMLTRYKEDYNVALRDLLSQWDQRMKGVTRKQIEDALDGAGASKQCPIVRRHYEKASTTLVATTGVLAGGAVHYTRNQVMKQSDRSDSVHMNQAGFPSTSAASEEDTGDIVQRGEQVSNQAEQEPTVRKRGGLTSNFKMELTTETKDGNRSTGKFSWTGNSKEQTFCLGIVLCLFVVLVIFTLFLSFGILKI